MNAMPWMKADDAGNNCPCSDRTACKRLGAKCIVGYKVLCVRPRRGDTEYNMAFGAMRKDCTERKKISHETMNKALEALGKAADAAGKAAAASAASGR